MVLQLRLYASSAGGLGSIPDLGTRSHMLWLRPGAAKIEKKERKNFKKLRNHKASFYNFNFHLFILTALGLQSSLLLGLFSSCRVWGLLSLTCASFSLLWPLLLWSTGFRSWSLLAQSLWLIGLVAPWHVESSGIWEETQVPCIGQNGLYHHALYHQASFNCI